MKRIITVCAIAAILPASLVQAQTKKPSPPVKAQNQTRGQGQVAGGDGVFGTTYTLNDGLNFQIISARYSVEPYNAYETDIARTDEKFLILTVSIKNTNTSDMFTGGEEFTVVDEKEQNYQGHNYRLNSLGIGGFGPNLKPGQGIGQTPAADELTVAIKVPAKARISKIILNNGRKTVTGEKVVRFFVADLATKARDGQDGNPKNVIKPLPEEVRDPADKTGATALTEGIAKIGQSVATGYFAVSLDSVTLSATEKLNGNPPAEGKQFAIATVTVKSLYGKKITLFEMGPDQFPLLKDTDGEKYHIVPDSSFRKSKRDEQADNGLEMATGESYTIRYYFEIPKDAKLKTITFGMESGHHYTADLAGAK